MRRTVITLISSFIAMKIAKEARDFIVADAGSLETRRLRKAVDQIFRKKKALHKMGREDLLDAIKNADKPPFKLKSEDLPTDLRIGTYST